MSSHRKPKVRGGNKKARDNYVMIPYEVIHDTDMDVNRVLVLSAILFSQWKCADVFAPTVNELLPLIDYSGYVARRSNRSIINKYRAIVIELAEDGYLSNSNLADGNSDSGTGGLIYNRKNQQCAIIWHSEFNELVYKRKRETDANADNKTNVATALLLLAHTRVISFSHHKDKVKYYYNYINIVCERLGLSYYGCSSARGVLKALGILHSEELPRFTDADGKWHSNVTLFIDMKAHLSKDKLDYSYNYEVHLPSIRYTIYSTSHFGSFQKECKKERKAKAAKKVS